jgi:hypothetical protein
MCGDTTTIGKLVFLFSHTTDLGVRSIIRIVNLNAVGNYAMCNFLI